MSKNNQLDKKYNLLTILDGLYVYLWRKIINLIAGILEVEIGIINKELAVGDIPEWDSLAHMRIIAALESDLGVVLDIEQVLEIEDVEDIIDAVINNE